MATRKKQAGSFLKKNPLTTQNLGKSAAKFAIRGGSAIAAKAGSNMAKNVIPKWHSPILLALGLAGECFIENEYARSAFEGIGVYGAMKATEDFIPENSSLRQHLGLGATDNVDNVVVDSTPNWDELAEEIDFTEVDDDDATEELEGMEDMAIYDGIEEEFETLNVVPM